MASTFSSSLNLELMATGENVGTWGTRANDRVFQLLDEAVAGYVAVSVSAVVSLDIAQASSSPGRHRWIEIVGNYPVSGAFNVRIPAVEKDYWLKVSVSTSGVLSMNVAVSGQGGATVTAVSATNRVQVLPWRRFLCDGTSVYDIGHNFIPNTNIYVGADGIATVNAITTVSGVSAEVSIGSSGTLRQVGLAGGGTLRLPSYYVNAVSLSVSTSNVAVTLSDANFYYLFVGDMDGKVTVSMNTGGTPTGRGLVGKPFYVQVRTSSGACSAIQFVAPPSGTFVVDQTITTTLVDAFNRFYEFVFYAVNNGLDSNGVNIVVRDSTLCVQQNTLG